MFDRRGRGEECSKQKQRASRLVKYYNVMCLWRTFAQTQFGFEIYLGPRLRILLTQAISLLDNNYGLRVKQRSYYGHIILYYILNMHFGCAATFFSLY